MNLIASTWSYSCKCHWWPHDDGF